jgi:hypothetical protein
MQINHFGDDRLWAHPFINLELTAELLGFSFYANTRVLENRIQ